MKTKQKEDWEDDFDLEMEGCLVVHVCDTTLYAKIKDFIKKQMTKARKEGRRKAIKQVKEKIIGHRWVYGICKDNMTEEEKEAEIEFITWYNESLERLLSSLTEKGKEV